MSKFEEVTSESIFSSFFFLFSTLITMNLFPQQPSFSPQENVQILPNYRVRNTNLTSLISEPALIRCMKKEDHRAQMTMVYNGKVIIFNDLSYENAQQIIHVAEQEGTSSQVYTKLDHRPVLPMPNNPNQWSFLHNLNQHNTLDTSMEFPIARRNSLNRFLEKRIDRCGGRGPYHNSGRQRGAASGTPQVANKWWLGLAPQPRQ